MRGSVGGSPPRPPGLHSAAMTSDSGREHGLEDLGVTDVSGQTIWSGAINAAGAAAMAITAPIWGLLADRYGRKPMLLRGLFGGAGVVVLMGFASAPWQLLGLRVLEGTLTGTVAAATALIATSAPKRRLGYALGMVQTAVFAGAAAGPLFGGFAYDRIGPRATFVLAGAMLFCGGVGMTTPSLQG